MVLVCGSKQQNVLAEIIISPNKKGWQSYLSLQPYYSLFLFLFLTQFRIIILLKYAISLYIEIFRKVTIDALG